jgi:hypothetical protein
VSQDGDLHVLRDLTYQTTEHHAEKRAQHDIQKRKSHAGDIAGNRVFEPYGMFLESISPGSAAARQRRGSSALCRDKAHPEPKANVPTFARLSVRCLSKGS